MRANVPTIRVQNHSALDTFAAVAVDRRFQHLLFCWFRREGGSGGRRGILTVSVRLKYTTSPLIRPRHRAPGGCNCRCVPVKLSHYQRKLDGSPPIRSPPSDQTPQKERLAGGTPLWNTSGENEKVAMQISRLAPPPLRRLLVKIALNFVFFSSPPFLFEIRARRDTLPLRKKKMQGAKQMDAAGQSRAFDSIPSLMFVSFYGAFHLFPFPFFWK